MQDDTKSIVSLSSSSSSSIKSVHTSDDEEVKNLKYEIKKEEFLVNDDDDETKSSVSSSNSVHLIVDETSINVEPNTTNQIDLDVSNSRQIIQSSSFECQKSSATIADDLAAKMIKEFSTNSSSDYPCGGENTNSNKIMDQQEETQLTTSSKIKPLTSMKWTLVQENNESYMSNLNEPRVCVRIGEFVKFKFTTQTNTISSSSSSSPQKDIMDDSSNANYSIDDNNENYSTSIHYEYFIGRVENFFKSDDVCKSMIRLRKLYRPEQMKNIQLKIENDQIELDELNELVLTDQYEEIECDFIEEKVNVLEKNSFEK